MTTAPAPRPTATPRLLLVHAHPDDESIWTGGTIARYAAQGVAVTVVTCTLGEQGEVIPEALRGLGPDHADQLGGYRVGELRAACAVLGVDDHRFLGGIGRWRDSGMLWDAPGFATAAPDAHPRAFALGDLAEQTAALVEVLREVRPQVVVTYGPDGGYGHPDHVRAHDVTMSATAQVPEVLRVFHVVNAASAVKEGLAEIAALGDAHPYQVPAVGEVPSTPDDEVDSVVDVAEHVPAKLDAMRAHATQVQVWHGGGGEAVYALSNDIAQPVPRAESYVLASGNPAGAATDLFGGLPGGRGEVSR
ncbi:N-acetyl-1-D-myo-inositol-2-amino-2-deoxy-alpha-D-glucopyranoside deacetylase [Actinoalloteichus sp. AHMU CJ021]|uniref:1D-myo-inositol 2-acetamido-2-deoxy-alpha-D-glucopyranoside deacetylase n=1 Tax=Actinoalloteichus caeruleus DSM 43889 TaxID=1120930 RepID=A0ABT1JJ32_ACTCY|nr:N-acetyl-1-D-myo-inositol-2-amino-2-deoxy-alpha-D-glucopyranoside deacetylase [Actinoalloteichus caeruleus]AUS78248.1 N-acetyl-1-D-myo-inositol-2-amino-2-deoxy-alpha-D-glucopyranoside deacetylase [Actinoalloteichus sp. AHMU CJ021]MCP2332299.1 N-acetyl-1-D-myo-inositol-2-amino-2-deoxy-alpha-D-glucopyranoside deacetylase [Actinoalloteichus caeruleus DSM 43889]